VTPGSALLSVRDLRTQFVSEEGIVKAVDGASFDVYPGRTLGIVGESGCGKSVTARSILRIVERPGRIVSGQILWREDANGSAAIPPHYVDLAQLDPNGPRLRAIRGGEIGLVFQEPMASFSPVHTVGNQIMENIRVHRRVTKREARNRAIGLLRAVGVPRAEQRIDMYAYQLSGGLRQRAMIALALACHPKLLIADEPTTALDVTTQAQILGLLRSLRDERDMAIVLITHNMGVIAEMADDVVVMYLGEVVEKGPVDAIFHHPKHPYTQLLLKSIPSIRSEPRSRLPTISGSVPHPFNRPSGCPFHPRCPAYMAGRCESDEPTRVRAGDQHEVSCFLYGGD
jgi:oligopeptide/dipeptide ABC transporter ATP-binding protein